MIVSPSGDSTDAPEASSVPSSKGITSAAAPSARRVDGQEAVARPVAAELARDQHPAVASTCTSQTGRSRGIGTEPVTAQPTAGGRPWRGGAAGRGPAGSGRRRRGRRVPRPPRSRSRRPGDGGERSTAARRANRGRGAGASSTGGRSALGRSAVGRGDGGRPERRVVAGAPGEDAQDEHEARRQAAPMPHATGVAPSPARRQWADHARGDDGRVQVVPCRRKRVSWTVGLESAASTNLAGRQNSGRHP